MRVTMGGGKYPHLTPKMLDEVLMCVDDELLWSYLRRTRQRETQPSSLTVLLVYILPTTAGCGRPRYRFIVGLREDDICGRNTKVKSLLLGGGTRDDASSRRA